MFFRWSLSSNDDLFILGTFDYKDLLYLNRQYIAYIIELYDFYKTLTSRSRWTAETRLTQKESCKSFERKSFVLTFVFYLHNWGVFQKFKYKIIYTCLVNIPWTYVITYVICKLVIVMMKLLHCLTTLFVVINTVNFL